MPVKYECPKCGRRFTEWGAEKVGFKCPKISGVPKTTPTTSSWCAWGRRTKAFRGGRP